MAYRMIIDRMKCENNGRCIAVAGNLLQPGSDGSPVVALALFGVEHEAVARTAARACPMGALHVEAVADP